MQTALQVVQGQEHRSDTGPVVESLARGFVFAHLNCFAADGNQIPHSNSLSQFAGGETHIDKKLSGGNVLFAALRGEDVGRAAGDDARQVPPSVDDDLLAGQHPFVDAANR